MKSHLRIQSHWRLSLTLTTLIFSAAFVSMGAVQEVVRLAADLTTTARGSNPSSLTVINDELYFIATDGTHGSELWKTDGTNVTRLTDIIYGTTFSAIGTPAIYNGDIYFRGASLSNSLIDVELWKLSGTNLSKVADIRPGAQGSNPANLTEYNGSLYFTANEGTAGTELWVYDGVSVNFLIDLYSGAAGSDPTGLTVFNGTLCFAATNNIFGAELFFYNGVSLTPIDINNGTASSNPSGFTVFNGLLHFQATDGTSGAELWAFDGLSLYQVADIRSGPTGSNPGGFTVYNGLLYFSADDGVNGTEVWVYDGVNPPTRVTQIRAGAGPAAPTNFRVYAGNLYFSANDGTFGAELWKYNGTTATRITDLNPGSASASPSNLREYRGYLYLSVIDATGSRELWRYDGTTVAKFAEIHPGTDNSYPGGSAVFNGALYFTASSTNASTTHFYKYGGSNATTVSSTIYPQSAMVEYKGALHFRHNSTLYKFNGTNITSAIGLTVGSIDSLRVFNGALYFSGTESATGTELYRYNGTNITRVTDIFPGTGSSSPSSPVEFKGALYFIATDATGLGLWKYDGTNSTRAGTATVSSQTGLMIYKDMILTCAATNGINFQPWKWNGTNFSLAAQINPFLTNSGAIVWATNHNAAYIMANDGTYGYELWKYDGTNATRITDFSGLAAYYTFAFKNAVYFMADDGITGLELWKYDGTTVSQVADINLGYPGSMATRMQEFNNAYYFSADDGVFGNELWRLDPVSQLVRITSITKQGNNITLSWTSPGGMSNVLQSATSGAGGSFTNNFSDRSSVLVAPTGSVVTLNYLDVGGATNIPGRYYRIRLP